MFVRVEAGDQGGSCLLLTVTAWTVTFRNHAKKILLLQAHTFGLHLLL